MHKEFRNIIYKEQKKSLKTIAYQTEISIMRKIIFLRKDPIWILSLKSRITEMNNSQKGLSRREQKNQRQKLFEQKKESVNAKSTEMIHSEKQKKNKEKWIAP